MTQVGDQLCLDLPVDVPEEVLLLEIIARAGNFSNVRSCGRAGICGTRRLMFTGGLFTGLKVDGYFGRYCYETEAEAMAALQLWDGRGDPPGRWVKFKSSHEERLGPGSSDA